MIDPFNKQRKYLLWSFILIVFLIITGIATAAEKSKWLNENPCMIKVVITNTEVNGITTTTKEEKLECKDGYDGPNYWELFAQFYYSGITVPVSYTHLTLPTTPYV